MPEFVMNFARDVWWVILLLGGAIAFAWLSQAIALAAAKKTEAKSGTRIYTAVLRRGRGPILTLILLATTKVAVRLLPLGDATQAILVHATTIGVIGAVGWLVIALLTALQDVITAHYILDVQDNLKARRVHTQTRMLRRVAMVLVIVITVSMALMTFANIRAIGTGILASAGVAGLVAGLAARPLVSNLVAGMQVALAEPIRIQDVVIIEGEWGWIEEITTTYVVVRIWDLRRLIVPLSYFFEHPFQNWTRVTAELLGTVFIYVDYSLPTEEVRKELHRILEASGLWDGKVWGLQVTNATDRVMELRALMSAPNSSRGWDLRCHVREKLISFLQANYPQCLPRARVELQEMKKPDGGDDFLDSTKKGGGEHGGPSPAS
jgi:small-conductance mechanosensitive channel